MTTLPDDFPNEQETKFRLQQFAIDHSNLFKSWLREVNEFDYEEYLRTEREGMAWIQAEMARYEQATA